MKVTQIWVANSGNTWLLGNSGNTWLLQSWESPDFWLSTEKVLNSTKVLKKNSEKQVNVLKKYRSFRSLATYISPIENVWFVTKIKIIESIVQNNNLELMI